MTYLCTIYCVTQILYSETTICPHVTLSY